ncbi:hypothetical protein H2200_001098 [Cladophialophora chaetospira]|uniref:NAD-dependent epimerase/dehydratase domain-containing protein n=1 Tax=Cladophialophora chaetospira TaxID=386627 RepID=A0AA39CNR0_9EURO|nr:hypothetical protein H2200_001098 [Cladophialophora chaetospira]
MGSITQKNETVLITGISGFVGSWITHAFLDAGYNVRGTVRSEKSIEGVKKKHAKHADRLSFAIVPDMAAIDALNDAVKGVTGVIHTANPFILNPKDNEEELLKPSISGVLNALRASAKEGSSLRRVVLLASFASILDLSKGTGPGITYDESVWNPATYEEAKASDSGAFTYCAAKALAERAAWDWIEANKPSFSFLTITPPWIFGPTLGGLKSVEHLNESTEAIWKLVDGSLKTVPDPDFAGCADVRDVALAHVRGYELEEAGGERFIVGGSFEYQTAVDILRKEFPQIKDRIPEGTPGHPPEIYAIDNSKVKKVLGIKLTPVDVTLKDTVAGLLDAEKNSAS